MNMTRYGKGITGALAVAIILVLSVSDGEARPRRAGYCAEGFGVHQLNRMQERLNLTDAQVTKIYTVGTQYREKYFQNRKNPDKLRSLRENHRKKIEKVLTPEQKEKFRNRRQDNDRPARKRRHRSGY